MTGWVCAAKIPPGHRNRPPRARTDRIVKLPRTDPKSMGASSPKHPSSPSAPPSSRKSSFFRIKSYLLHYLGPAFCIGRKKQIGVLIREDLLASHRHNTPGVSA